MSTRRVRPRGTPGRDGQAKPQESPGETPVSGAISGREGRRFKSFHPDFRWNQAWGALNGGRPMRIDRPALPEPVQCPSHAGEKRSVVQSRRPPRAERRGALDVAELCGAYAGYCFGVYVKRGVPTNTARNAAKAGQLLVRSGLADCPLAAFGPLRLLAFQAWLVSDTSLDGRCQWSRRTINEYVRHIVRMFRWAGSRQLVDREGWQGLGSVDALRRGRPAGPGLPVPREGRPRDTVPVERVDAVLAVAPPMLAAMIRLQTLTGMRPNEMLHLTPAAIARTGDGGVWCYEVPPEANKTEHLGIERRVYLGRRAMDLLGPWRPDDPADHFFDPRRAEDLRQASRRATRKSPRWPSHAAETRRARRGQDPAALNGRYSPASYRRAIARLCTKAGVPAWSPYQLRHNAATGIAERESIEVARLILGHRDIKTTMRYVKVGEHRLIASAALHG